jgi:hypothetical protein
LAENNLPLIFATRKIKPWPVRLSVRTAPFHGAKTGSIPVPATKHLNNNFSNTLKVNVKKNRFIKFLLRLTQNNLSKAGDKQELVNSLHKKILFKKGNNYLPMNYEYFYKLLVDESKAPKLELFSFLKI